MGTGHLFMGTRNVRAQKKEVFKGTVGMEFDQVLTTLLTHETAPQRTKDPEPQIIQPLLVQGHTVSLPHENTMQSSWLLFFHSRTLQGLTVSPSSFEPDESPIVTPECFLPLLSLLPS